MAYAAHTLSLTKDYRSLILCHTLRLPFLPILPPNPTTCNVVFILMDYLTYMWYPQITSVILVWWVGWYQIICMVCASCESVEFHDLKHFYFKWSTFPHPSPCHDVGAIQKSKVPLLLDIAPLPKLQFERQMPLHFVPSTLYRRETVTYHSVSPQLAFWMITAIT
jgi:hypothetical protein